MQAWARGIGARGAKLVGRVAPELPRGLVRVDGGRVRAVHVGDDTAAAIETDLLRLLGER
jgi:hypothetical protein